MYLSKYASLTSDCPKWFNACRNTFSEQPDFFSKRQKNQVHRLVGSFFFTIFATSNINLINL